VKLVVNSLVANEKKIHAFKFGLMKNFIKAMNQEEAAFTYLLTCEKSFPD